MTERDYATRGSKVAVWCSKVWPKAIVIVAWGETPGNWDDNARCWPKAIFTMNPGAGVLEYWNDGIVVRVAE
jgi:hypothetical protein